VSDLRILHITLKKKWFDMSHPDIHRDLIKDEEYREIKPYWIQRLRPLIEEKKPFMILAKNGYLRESPFFERLCMSVGIDFPVPRWTDGDTRSLHFVLNYNPVFSELRWCKLEDLKNFT